MSWVHGSGHTRLLLPICKLQNQKKKREKIHQIMHIHGQPHSSHLNKSLHNRFLYKHGLIFTNSRLKLNKGGKSFPTILSCPHVSPPLFLKQKRLTCFSSSFPKLRRGPLLLLRPSWINTEAFQCAVD